MNRAATTVAPIQRHPDEGGARRKHQFAFSVVNALTFDHLATVIAVGCNATNCLPSSTVQPGEVLNETRNCKPHARPAPKLSPREGEVLRHFSTGFTYAQTANRMGISSHTVDTYLRRIREKTGAGSGAELTRLAVVLEMRDSDCV